MQIAICDDDPLFTEQLKQNLTIFFKKKHLSCPKISTFSSGDSLLSSNESFDLFFLDIEMPGVNGIYVGNKLSTSSVKPIIFIVTSYMEYLDDAMRFHVFRYLSKPLDQHRLFCNLEDAIRHYNTINQKIAFETKEGIYTLFSSALITIEAHAKKSIVHTANKDYQTIHPIKYWENQLPSSQFFRTHRSFYVNLEHVTGFNHMTVFTDAAHITAYLTQRKYRAFKDAYLLYLESTR